MNIAKVRERERVFCFLARKSFKGGRGVGRGRAKKRRVRKRKKRREELYAGHILLCVRVCVCLHAGVD